MEMESSRRQFDRSREPGLKKPRLSDESDHRKPFPAPSPAINPMVSRLRAAEGGGGGGGGGGYQPQPIPAAAMHQELVSQYKGALAELTFNSKPIITNLTIIAGENLQAARGIANAVCTNIIEVPSEQKLPSLYLLDSIVKNIGKDYIKHFAAKLPEVFCKAFRQVDGPIHQSMRHLFGTWKGVFPLQALQIIEKELGFNSAVNGSATGSTTTNRTDSQSNRPSIHVNPKYLERRLQQPSRAKGLSNDVSGSVVNSIDDVESVGRATSISTGRSWADPSVKIHNMQRLQRGSEGIHEKNIGAEYTNYDYGSDFPRSSGLGIERTNARISDQGYEKPWYGDSSGLAESLSGQRNSLDIKQGFPNYPTPKPTNTTSLLQSVKNISSRSTSGILGDSWKNSDEEEFRWGDVNSRLMDHGASDISSNFRKDRSASVDSDKSGLEDQIQKPHSIRDYTHRINKEVSTEQKDPSFVGHRISSSSWSSLESHSVDGLPHSGTSSIGFPGNGASGSTVATTQQRFQPLKAGPLSLGQNLQLQNLAEQDRAKTQSLGHPDHKVSQFSNQLNIGMHHNPYSRSVTTEKLATEDALASSLIPGIQRHQYVFPPQAEDPTESETSNQIQKQLPHRISSSGISTTLSSYAPDHPNSLSVNTLVDSSTSSILAAVMKSGVLSNSSITNQNLRQPPLQKAQSVLPSGPLSIKSTNPRSKVVPVLSEGRSSHDNQLGSVKISQKKQSPVQSDPPPALSPMHSGSEKEKASKDVKNAADPISSLLSSLVAKGLISASKTELPTQTPRVAAVSTETKKKKKKKSLSVANTSSARKSLVSVSTVSSTKADVASVSEPSSSRPVSFGELTKSEVKSIIGFDFKQDLIREFHPTVVSDLLDGFEHSCNTCGLRLKLEEQLNRHMELHDVKESSGPNASRRWYASSFDWISRLTPGFKSVELEEETGKDEPMVPSDESQCACVLCGEVFEDFFCQERDEWMFKGAKHLMVPSGVGSEVENLEDKEGLLTGPIVHANCISETSLQNLGLAGRVKTERDV